jgi:RNA polymerase sigma factor (sigma-70 family)
MQVRELSDEQLMQAYTGGDRRAFEELFSRYAPRITRLLRRDVAPTEDADDLVQQTFLQLHRARRDFRPGASVRPWLYTIAFNLKRQYFRRRGRKPETSLEGAPLQDARGRDPEAAIYDAQLRAALKTLPEPQREAIVLHWFEGLSYAEVAQIVGAKESAVRVRAHRGYGKLRELLETSVTNPVPSAYASSKTSHPS